MGDKDGRNPAILREDDPVNEDPSVDPDPRSILVSNIPEGINRDKLEIHFMRKSNGGGDVANITMLDSSTATITFDSVSAVEGVLKKDQVIRDVKVTVKRLTDTKKAPPTSVPETAEDQQSSFEKIPVFTSVRATVKEDVSRSISDPWLEEVRKNIPDVKIQKDKRREVIKVSGLWDPVRRVRSLLQIQAKVSQDNASGDVGSGRDDVTQSTTNPRGGDDHVTTEAGATSRGANERGASGNLDEKVKSTDLGSHQHGEDESTSRDAKSGYPSTDEGHREIGKKSKALSRSNHDDTSVKKSIRKDVQSGDSPIDGEQARHAHPGKASAQKYPQIVHSSSQTEGPETIVVVPDIMSYITQVHGAKILDIIQKNRAVIVPNEDKTEVQIYGSSSIHSNPGNAAEEFTNLYQNTHHTIVCKTFDPRAEHLPSRDVRNAVEKLEEDFPRVLLKIGLDGAVLFYGTESDVQEARRAMCDHLGISTARGRRRRGEGGTAGGPNRQGVTGVGSVPSTYREWFNHTTEEGIQVVVAHGDITQQAVDAIANAANEDLAHGSGVAGAISKAGGPSVQKESKNHVKTHGRLWVTETAVTGGGQLPCKHIIHAVGPRWSHEHGETNKRQLRQTCYNVLVEATETLKAKSVAVPAISSGIFGMPLQICADSLLSGLLQFLQRANPATCTLRRICFIDVNQETVKVLTDTFKKGFSSTAPSHTTYPAASRNGKVSRPPSDQYSQRLEDDTASRKSHPNPGETGKGLTSDGGNVDGKPADDCSICMSAITDPKSLPCKHTFCRECIDTALSYKSQCPMCNAIVGELKGNQPPGRMDTQISHWKRLPGYENCAGAIEISYYFPGGIQGPDHPNPGRRYSGTSRRAYLPNNDEGRELVKLLKRAFDNRLVFTIGTSVTTGATDTVVWNDIHHKTNVSGGASGYGYPDPSYLSRLREELASKGIK